MRITSWSAFKLTLGIYLMGYWISTLTLQIPLFVYYNQSSDYPVQWWIWLQNQQLLAPYLYLLSFSALGLIIPRLTRTVAIINLIHLLLLYRFTNGLLLSPSTPFFGWALLWMSVFPQELSKGDKKIWWILITAGYFCSGLGKILSPLWASGDALSALSFSAISAIKSPMTDYPFLKQALNQLTLIIELGGIFIIWWDWGRKILWYVLIPFLVGIIFFMNVPEVGLLMLILNLALWEEGPSLSSLYSRLSIRYNTFIKKKTNKV